MGGAGVEAFWLTLATPAPAQPEKYALNSLVNLHLLLRRTIQGAVDPASPACAEGDEARSGGGHQVCLFQLR